MSGSISCQEPESRGGVGHPNGCSMMIPHPLRSRTGIGGQTAERREKSTFIPLRQEQGDLRRTPGSMRGRRAPSRPRRAPGIAHLSEGRSEEHTSELQSLMRISYAVFCLKKKKHIKDATYVT